MAAVSNVFDKNYFIEFTLVGEDEIAKFAWFKAPELTLLQEQKVGAHHLSCSAPLRFSPAARAHADRAKWYSQQRQPETTPEERRRRRRRWHEHRCVRGHRQWQDARVRVRQPAAAQGGYGGHPGDSHHPSRSVHEPGEEHGCGLA